MTETTETITETTQFPIFKGAIYNTTVSNNTLFFGTDLSPTNTPTTFRMFLVLNPANSVPWIQRTNGTNVVTEKIQGAIQISNSSPVTFDFLVGPNDTINFIMPTGSGTAAIITMIVIEVDTPKGYNPIRVAGNSLG